MAVRTALTRGLGRIGLYLLVPLALSMIILSSINFAALTGASGLPDIPKVDQATMDKAAALAVGQDLKRQGYNATAVIDDKGLVQWLDEQEHHDGVSNPGPYVLFHTGASQADKPDPSVAPDIVVDATQGVKVAVYQTYTDGRGAACYNGGDVKDIRYILGQNWVFLNIYLQSKFLDNSYDVTRDNLSQLPPSVKVVHCYTFKP